MKKFSTYLFGAILFSSCQVFKPAAPARTTGAEPARPEGRKPGTAVTRPATTKPARKKTPVEMPPVPEPDPIDSWITPEMLYDLQFKYAILLDAPVEEMLDHKLIETLESWYGTRYRLGGVDRKGIDCSAFVQSFLVTLYSCAVPRTANEQYKQSKAVGREELTEGDLVFFRTTRKKTITHVGVYLRNNKFVHASSSSGVMISDLNEPYFMARYAGAGRYRAVKQEIAAH